MSQTKQDATVFVRAFHFFGSMHSALQRMGESAHSAVFMGLIDDATFQEYDSYPYGQWEGGLEVGEDKDEQLPLWFRNWVVQLPSNSRILVVGAGGGRELRLLHKLGHDVSGLEYDVDLALHTKAFLEGETETSQIPVLNVKRFETPGLKEPFDAIVISRFYLSYIHNRARRINFLSQLRGALKEDGQLATDYFTRSDNPKSAGAILFRVQKPVANFLRALRGRGFSPIETGDHLDPKVPLLHHHYTSEEIESELISSGFQTVSQDKTWYGWSVAKPKSSIRTGQKMSPSRPEPAVS